MADNTINYNLIRPGADDFYNIQEFNDNMTIIDTELKKLDDGKAPSGHGLGTIPQPYTRTEFKSIMQYGSGFYQVDLADDSPTTSPTWKAMVQLATNSKTGLESGGQLLMSIDEIVNPRIWYRNMIEGAAGKWVEMLHTGNLPNYANTRIQTNSYMGTGVGGENVPNRLTFEFVPKLVIVSAPASEGGKLIAIHGQSSTELVNCGAADVNTSNVADMYLNWSGKTLSWYVTYGSNHEKKSTYQLNRSGVVYHWVAFA